MKWEKFLPLHWAEDISLAAEDSSLAYHTYGEKAPMVFILNADCVKKKQTHTHICESWPDPARIQTLTSYIQSLTVFLLILTVVYFFIQVCDLASIVGMNCSQNSKMSTRVSKLCEKAQQLTSLWWRISINKLHDFIVNAMSSISVLQTVRDLNVLNLCMQASYTI